MKSDLSSLIEFINLIFFSVTVVLCLFIASCVGIEIENKFFLLTQDGQRTDIEGILHSCC